MSNRGRRRSSRTTAELRRDQLLEIASRIVETEGVEALRPTRVAALAGCTRPLIYQYFPRREDLYIAITEDLYRSMDATLGVEMQTRVIPCASKGDNDPAVAYLNHLFDYVGEHGPASLILRSTPEISKEFKAYLKRIRESYEQRWLEGFMVLGFDDAQAELLLETFIVVTKVLALQHLKGQIDRETAIHRQLTTVGGMLQMLVRPP